MCESCGLQLHHPLAPSRRKFILGAAAIGLAFAGRVEAKEKKREEEDDKKKKPPKPQNVLSPDAALERLREGNARYVRGLALRHDFKHEREAMAAAQNPYAADLSFADIRTKADYAFDT